MKSLNNLQKLMSVFGFFTVFSVCSRRGSTVMVDSTVTSVVEFFEKYGRINE
jgi:hypothetical protein